MVCADAESAVTPATTPARASLRIRTGPPPRGLSGKNCISTGGLEKDGPVDRTCLSGCPARPLVIVLELALEQLAQLEALYLAGRGARQLGHAADPLGPLVARQLLARLAGGGDCLGRLPACGDKEREALEAVGVGDLHACRLAHQGGVRDRLLQFARLHPLAGDLDQLIGTALVY